MTASSPFIVECLLLDADGRVFSFYTRRGGGCSTGAYASMNCTHYCGDSMDNVMANRATLIAALPHTPQRLLLPRQVHGVKVHDLRPDDLRLGEEGAQYLLDGVDAIVTAVKGVCIAVSTADCVPLLAYSPEGVIATIHAGWRGTVAGIVRRAVGVMTGTYGCDPARIKVYMPPSISLQAFEVGDEVYDAFAGAGFEMPSISMRDAASCKWHIDLPEANTRLLLAEGLSRENITASGICTYANYQEYFSARRLGAASGRMLSGIMLI